MTHYSVGDTGTLGPEDSPELTHAADLHIMLLPSDQSCAPAGGDDSARDTGTLGPDDPPELTHAADLHIMLLPSDQSYAPAGERGSTDLTLGSPSCALWGSTAPRER
jgi:hypothetical protein